MLIYPFIFGIKMESFCIGFEFTYPSSSSLSSWSKIRYKPNVLTKVLRFWVNTALSLIVCEKVVQLNLSQKTVGSLKSILLDLDHANLLLKPTNLTEIHLSLHSCEVFESSLPFGKTFKSFLKASSKVHLSKWEKQINYNF